MFSQILDLADKLDIIQTVKAKLCASPIPPDLRGEYLQRVAGLLRGREFGDGDVFRACVAAVKATIWDT